MTYKWALCFNGCIAPLTLNFIFSLFASFNGWFHNYSLLLIIILKWVKGIIQCLLCSLKLNRPIFGIAFHSNFELSLNIICLFFKFGYICGFLRNWLLKWKFLALIVIWVFKILLLVIYIHSGIFLAIAPLLSAKMSLVNNIWIILLISILKSRRYSLQSIIYLCLYTFLSYFTSVLCEYSIWVWIVDWLWLLGIEMLEFFKILHMVFLIFVHFWSIKNINIWIIYFEFFKK